MRYSKQRETILAAVKSSYDHPTAEEVYELVKTEIPNISLGTVYRNLNALSDQGEIKRIKIANSSDHFDSTLNYHHHAYCDICHNIFDIKIKDEFNFDNLLIEDKFQILEVNICFTGICNDCQNRKKDLHGIKRK